MNTYFIDNIRFNNYFIAIVMDYNDLDAMYNLMCREKDETTVERYLKDVRSTIDVISDISIEIYDYIENCSDDDTKLKYSRLTDSLDNMQYNLNKINDELSDDDEPDDFYDDDEPDVFYDDDADFETWEEINNDMF